MTLLEPQVFRDNLLGLDLRTIEGSQDPRSASGGDGVIFPTNGGITKIPGRKVLVTGLTGSGNYMTAFAANDGTRTKIIYCDDGATGTWYKWNDDGTKTSLGTVTAGGFVQAAQFEQLLIMLSTKDVPKKWSPTVAFASLAGWTPTYGAEAATDISKVDTSITPGANPSLVERHVNRLWFSGDADNPSTLYYSGNFTPETWANSVAGITRAGWLHVYPEDGNGPITAIKSWQNQLVVFKERAVYFITGSSPQTVANLTNYFQIAKLVLPYGTCSPNAIVPNGNDLLFIDCNGYERSLQNTITNAQAEVFNISYKVQPLFDDIPKPKALKYIYAADYVKRNHLWMGHHKGSSEHELSTNTRALYHLSGLTDVSGNSYDLTNTGSTPLHLGFNNYREDCYNFDGSTQRLAATGGIGAALTAFTLRCWVLPTALPTSGNKMYILHCDHSAGHFDIYLHNDGGTQKIKASITDSSSVEQIASYSASMSITDWTHIDVRWDGTTLTLYTDATSRATATVSTIETSNTEGFCLGSSDATANTDSFNGRIDEVEVLSADIGFADVAAYFSSYSSGNNRVSIFDYGKQSVPWMPTTDIIKPSSLWFDQRELKLYTSTYDGEIHLQDSGTSHGLTRREGYYTTAWLDAGYPDHIKKNITTELWLTAFQDGKMIVETTWEDRSGNNIIINLDSSAETTWGDNWTTELIWTSGTGRRLYKFKIHPSGHGKLHQLRFFGWEEDVQWTIVYWTIMWKLLGVV